jgi:hypothetical protein
LTGAQPLEALRLIEQELTPASVVQSEGK